MAKDSNIGGTRDPNVRSYEENVAARNLGLRDKDSSLFLGSSQRLYYLKVTGTGAVWKPDGPDYSSTKAELTEADYNAMIKNLYRFLREDVEEEERKTFKKMVSRKGMVAYEYPDAATAAAMIDDLAASVTKAHVQLLKAYPSAAGDPTSEDRGREILSAFAKLRGLKGKAQKRLVMQMLGELTEELQQESQVLFDVLESVSIDEMNLLSDLLYKAATNETIEGTRKQIDGGITRLNGLLTELLGVKALEEFERISAREQKDGSYVVTKGIEISPPLSAAKRAKRGQGASGRRGTTAEGYGTDFIYGSNIKRVGDFKYKNSTSKGDITGLFRMQGYEAELQFSIKGYYSPGATEYAAATNMSLQDLIYKRRHIVNFLLRYFDSATAGNDGAKRLVGAIFSDVAIGGKYLPNFGKGSGRALFGVTLKQETGEGGLPRLAINTFSLSRYYEALEKSVDSGIGVKATVNTPKVKYRKDTQIYDGRTSLGKAMRGGGKYSKTEADPKTMEALRLQQDYVRAKATTLTISAPLLNYYH